MPRNDQWWEWSVWQQGLTVWSVRWQCVDGRRGREADGTGNQCFLLGRPAGLPEMSPHAATQCGNMSICAVLNGWLLASQPPTATNDIWVWAIFNVCCTAEGDWSCKTGRVHYKIITTFDLVEWPPSLNTSVVNMNNTTYFFHNCLVVSTPMNQPVHILGDIEHVNNHQLDNTGSP